MTEPMILCQFHCCNGAIKVSLTGVVPIGIASLHINDVCVCPRTNQQSNPSCIRQAHPIITSSAIRHNVRYHRWRRHKRPLHLCIGS